MSKANARKAWDLYAEAEDLDGLHPHDIACAFMEDIQKVMESDGVVLAEALEDGSPSGFFDD